MGNEDLSLEQLERMKEDMSRDMLIYLFGTPRMPANPAQLKVLNAWTDPHYKIFTYTGGNRIGKTTLGVILDLCTMFGELPWSGEAIKFSHNEPRKVRLIGQDWDKQIRTVVVPTIEQWWPSDRPLKVTKNQLGVKTMWTDLRTGSTMEIMSNNQESRLFEGWFGDLIHWEEPPSRDNRIASARGLIDRGGREFYGMTLLNQAWVHKDVIMSRNPDGTLDRTTYNVNADISVNVGYGIKQEHVDQFAKTLNEDEKQARLYGKPAYMAQIVYPQFDRNTHVIKKFKKLPLDWMVDIAIDFHPSKPWAVLFMATDPRGFKYCIDEIWENGSWKIIGDEIVRRSLANNYRVNRIVIDPLSKGDKQSDLHEESVYMKLDRLFAGFDMPFQAAGKDPEGGVKLTQALLHTDNDMAALFFCEHLTRTTTEIENWMRDDNGKLSKIDDDMMENLGRLVKLDTQYEEMGEDAFEYEEELKLNSITGT